MAISINDRITIMEAKTDEHSSQPARHLGDLSFSVINMYEPVSFASRILTSELLGPTVLRRTPYVLLAASGCGVLLICSLVLCPLAPWQAFRFSIVLSYRYRTTRYRLSLWLSLSNYRNSFGTILSYRYRTTIPKNRYDIQH